ncbi:MAG: neutral zinc metallopeptidase, partial [Bacteroidales bacterium]|nr:neutral zinc metallopeptidase [Bacteroidales bacterium]
MKLDGRRESSNVDDRRGRSTATTVGGIGLGGIIIVGLISLLLGKNPLQALQTVQEIQ